MIAEEAAVGHTNDSDPVPTPPTRRSASVLVQLSSRCKIGVAGIAVATFVGYLAPLHFRFELATHFAAFYCGAAFIAIPILGLARQWAWAVAAGLLLLINGASIVTWYFPGDVSASANGARITVVTANVHTENTDHESLVDYILKAKPDILALQEVNAAWLHDLAPLRAMYPHRVERSREDNFGIALFSRRPLEDVNIIDLGGAEVPAIEASIAAGTAKAHILCVHTLPPISGTYARIRNAMLVAVGDRANQWRSPVIVLGDFNTSMWSPFYTQLIETSGLRNARQGFGILPTWPAGLAPFMIPLDHCLVSKDIAVTRCAVGPDIQSDHRPLQVELAINE